MYGAIMLLLGLSINSCVLFRPLPLEPIHNSEAVQSIETSTISKFDGNYELLSVDSNSSTLEYTFTYKSLFDSEKLPGKNDYIHLSAIDDRHIKVTLFINNKAVKTKTVRGRISNNYFEFHTNRLLVKYVFMSYRQQTNRIALSNEGDLYLDTNTGGIAFLLILPIPLSGVAIDTYNLKFKRKDTIY